MTTNDTTNNIITLPTAVTTQVARKERKAPVRKKSESLKKDDALAQLNATKKELEAFKAEHARVVAALDQSVEVQPEASGMQKLTKVALSAAIPLGYLGVSRLGAVALNNGVSWLAVMAAFFSAALMVVSLPHAAEAVKDLTHSGNRVAWALAVVIDGVLLTSEAASATVAQGLGLEGICQVLIVGVALFSAAFNYHAFNAHK